MINLYYGNLMNRMAQELRDYDIADSYYLDQAKVEGASLRIGKESFRVLVLPPLTTVRRSTLRKIEEFYRQGGTVVAVKMLPRIRWRKGATIRRLSPRSSAFSERPPARGGGKAYFIREDVNELFPILDARLRATSTWWAETGSIGRSTPGEGRAGVLLLVERQRRGAQAKVLLSVKGVSGEVGRGTGQREALASHITPKGTEVELGFAPWDAFYVVFGSPGAKVKAPEPVFTKLPDLRPTGNWRLTPEKKTMEAPTVCGSAAPGTGSERRTALPRRTSTTHAGRRPGCRESA